MHLAQELNIAAGITTTFLDKAIEELFEIEKFPSRLELIVRIEEELSLLQEKWEPLKKYLQGKEKKVIPLAKQLATLFVRYGIYGNTACQEWEKEPQNWQEDLWKRIFERWSYPLRMLSTLKKRACDATIHLFSFSHIPALYFHFFQQLDSVHFYQLSPCQEFWSDLSHEHPLLTHFGKVGREMAKLIEESDLITEETYILPEKKTQLHALQRELLSLEKEEKHEDRSLQLHISVTEHHEIQNLHATLSDLLQNEGLEPKDILVMAPNIALYEPFIRAVFEDSIPYQIADMPLQHNHPQVEGLFLLLGLEKRRFSAPAVLELFQHPLFQKKAGWNEEDLIQIRDWIEATGIRWGLDAAHRDALLKKRQCEKGIGEEGATWKAGIDHLLEELAIPYEPVRIDFTQAELLGEWKEVLDRLAGDLQVLHQRLTLREWVDSLKAMCESYFSESDVLFYRLEQLARAGRFAPNRTYSFDSIEQLLNEIVGEKNMTVNPNQLQTVRFCSMLPMRAIPAKVICLIGMNHDAFPRQENLFSLDLIKERGDYAPSRLDFDRYLFLEAILSAREKLIISYLGIDPYDHTPWPPSSVVTQLLSFLPEPIHHPVPVPIKEKRERPSLFVYHPGKVEIPPCHIDLFDFMRAFRSPLRHYLHARGVYVRDEQVIQEEEAFHLSPLRMSNLRKHEGDAFKKAQREGDFPLGSFGELARIQLEDEIADIPENLESREVNLAIGNVQLVGTLDGVFSEGLYAFEKKTVKGAVRSLPLFLILAALNPETKKLLFREHKEAERFFDDPYPYLQRAVDYYFLSQQIPTPLFPDWIEPILKEDSAKLDKVKHYDASLLWAFRGQGLLPSDELIASWKEEAEKLYKEMVDAWF